MDPVTVRSRALARAIRAVTALPLAA